LGQQVAELANKTFEPGQHKIIWNGKNQNGSRIASGLYVYRIQTDKKIATKKMLLVK
jgi:flagellar hook assembly protein FlgD